MFFASKHKSLLNTFWLAVSFLRCDTDECKCSLNKGEELYVRACMFEWVGPVCSYLLKGMKERARFLPMLYGYTCQTAVVKFWFERVICLSLFLRCTRTKTVLWLSELLFGLVLHRRLIVVHSFNSFYSFTLLIVWLFHCIIIRRNIVHYIFK